MSRSVQPYFVLVAVALLAGCPRDPVKRGEDAAMVSDAGMDAADAPTAPDMAAPDVQPDATLEPRCIDDPTTWSAGTPLFRERADAAGFLAINAEASHVSAVDWNGDGYADLALRRDDTLGVTWDDWESGARSFWLLENQGDGTFVDRTQESRITASRTDPTVGRPAELTIFGDVDNDGDLDAFTAYRNAGDLGEGAELMLNDGEGGFQFSAPEQAFRKANLPSPAYGAVFVDHNLDGLLDLWVAYNVNFGFPLSDALYEQDADGMFADRSSLYGIADERSLDALNGGRGPTAGWGATACDLNGDGRLELLSTSYGRLPNHLWLAGVTDGVPTYENVSVESGYAYDDRMDWSDDESARCWCTLHPDDEGCAGVPPPDVIPCMEDSDAFRWDHSTSREPYQLGGHTASTICADIDGDADLDLLSTELRHWDVGSSSDPTEILLNDGGARPVFSRPGREAMGLERVPEVELWDEGDLDAAVFDFDNDGLLDIWINSSEYPGTRAHLYRQVAAGSFEKVSLEDGVDLLRAKGIGVADFDRDGDLDVVAGRSPVRCDMEPECEGFHARYYENIAGNANNWVQLRLEGGDGTNRAAIGARVTVDNGVVSQVQEVGGGHGRLGIQHDLVLHFGLGAACEATVTVRWPDSSLTEQTVTLAAGYRWHLAQGGEARVE